MAFPGRVLAAGGRLRRLEGLGAHGADARRSGAPPEEQEAFKLRAGVYAAMTGVKPAAAAEPAAGGAAPKRKKAGGGGGGCGG